MLLLFWFCSFGVFDRRWAEHTDLDYFATRLVRLVSCLREAEGTRLLQDRTLGAMEVSG